MNDALSSQNLKLLFRHASAVSPEADFSHAARGVVYRRRVVLSEDVLQPCRRRATQKIYFLQSDGQASGR